MSLVQQNAFQNDAQLTSGVAPMGSIFPVSRSIQTNNIKGQVRPVSITLTELMFTGRVPVSTWTFVFAIHKKLWVSDLTTLYFGKRVGMNKLVFREKLYVPDSRLDMEIGVTAYNSYGNVLCRSEPMRAFLLNEKNTTSKLVRLDEDWTQLLFKFDIEIAK